MKGLAAFSVARIEEGTHLCCWDNGAVTPIRVAVWPVAGGVDPAALLAEKRRDIVSRMPPVVRIHQLDFKCVDLRSGGVHAAGDAGYLLAALPLPEELNT